MKNKIIRTITFSLLFLISLYSCKRESILTEKIINNPEKLDLSEEIFLKYVEGGSNKEILRIFNDFKNCKNSITIIDNINQGIISHKPGLDVFMSGKTKENFILKLNGISYRKVGKSWGKQGLELKNYFGKNVKFEIFLNNDIAIEKTLYIPKTMLFKLKNSQNQIERVGNNLSWIKDSENVSKKLLLYYRCFTADGSRVKAGVRVIEDDGDYNIDYIVKEDKIKKVSISLIRGNLFSAPINGGKNKV